jgi:hypothetical protein
MPDFDLMESLITAMGKIRDAGYKTFGNWSDSEMAAKAVTYYECISDIPKITPEIINLTATRYNKGKVTVWREGVHVPATREFPTSFEFKDACLQTWELTYRIVAIGEKIEDGAKVLVTSVERRDDPQPGVSALEAPATPEQVAAIKTRFERLPSMPSLSEAVTRREPRQYNAEAEAHLASIREKLRREA